MTTFESIIRQVTADWRASKGLPPLAGDMTIPASIRKLSVASVVPAALEAGRLDYLADPEAGRKRYLKSLREFTQEVDGIVAQLKERNKWLS